MSGPRVRSDGSIELPDAPPTQVRRELTEFEERRVQKVLPVGSEMVRETRMPDGSVRETSVPIVGRHARRRAAKLAQKGKKR